MVITAIIQSYRRQENIPIIIKSLRDQTIPPERIVVWNDNDGSGKDLKDLNVDIINTNTNNNGNWGAFLYTFLIDTKYIAVIDDDCPPGPKWFEFCIKNLRGKKIFTEFGIKLTDNTYKNSKKIRTRIQSKKSFRSVDMAGHTYFFNKNAVMPMLRKRPPFWHNIVDLHFSFMARKYKWKILVPMVENKDEQPYDRSIKLPYSDREKAMFKRGNHLNKRDEYIKWAVKNNLR